MAKDPALVYGYSNPKKVQLTEDGKLLGAQLWMDAHARHKVQPDNFITEAIARADIAHFSDALGLAEDYDVYAKPVKEVKGAGKRSELQHMMWGCSGAEQVIVTRHVCF